MTTNFFYSDVHIYAFLVWFTVAWFTNPQQQQASWWPWETAQDEFAAAIINWKLPSNNGLFGNTDRVYFGYVRYS